MKRSIPSIFKFKQAPKRKKRRKTPKKRSCAPETVIESDSFTGTSDLNDGSYHSENMFADCNPKEGEMKISASCDLLKVEIEELKKMRDFKIYIVS